MPLCLCGPFLPPSPPPNQLPHTVITKKKVLALIRQLCYEHIMNKPPTPPQPGPTAAHPVAELARLLDQILAALLILLVPRFSIFRIFTNKLHTSISCARARLALLLANAAAGLPHSVGTVESPSPQRARPIPSCQAVTATPSGLPATRSFAPRAPGRGTPPPTPPTPRNRAPQRGRWRAPRAPTAIGAPSPPHSPTARPPTPPPRAPPPRTSGRTRRPFPTFSPHPKPRRHRHIITIS